VGERNARQSVQNDAGYPADKPVVDVLGAGDVATVICGTVVMGYRVTAPTSNGELEHTASSTQIPSEGGILPASPSSTIEVLARFLCLSTCPLVQCDIDHGFCPYWRQRRFLVEDYCSSLMNWSA